MTVQLEPLAPHVASRKPCSHLSFSEQRKGTKTSQFHFLGNNCSFLPCSCQLLKTPRAQLLTTLGHKTSLWQTHCHLSPTIYKTFLPWPGHMISLAFISGTREPVWDLLCSYVCCYTFSIQLGLAYCVSGETYYLGHKTY